jgi:hypothetical protein
VFFTVTVNVGEFSYQDRAGHKAKQTRQRMVGRTRSFLCRSLEAMHMSVGVGGLLRSARMASKGEGRKCGPFVSALICEKGGRMEGGLQAKASEM